MVSKACDIELVSLNPRKHTRIENCVTCDAQHVTMEFFHGAAIFFFKFLCYLFMKLFLLEVA